MTIFISSLWLLISLFVSCTSEMFLCVSILLTLLGGRVLGPRILGCKLQPSGERGRGRSWVLGPLRPGHHPFPRNGPSIFQSPWSVLSELAVKAKPAQNFGTHFLTKVICSGIPLSLGGWEYLLLGAPRTWLAGGYPLYREEWRRPGCYHIPV